MLHFFHFSQSVTQCDDLVNFNGDPRTCKHLLFFSVPTKVFMFFHTTLVAKRKHERRDDEKVREDAATLLEEILYTVLHQKLCVFASPHLIGVADISENCWKTYRYSFCELTNGYSEVT